MCNQRSVKETLLWGILGGFFDTAHACCDYHEKLCSCDDCVLSDVASVMAPTLTNEAPPLSNEDVYPYSLFRTKHGSNSPA